jgi:hypothetical protein
MLDPLKPDYWSVMIDATSYAQITVPVYYIALPWAVKNVHPSIWVNKDVWKRGNPEEISEDVFIRIGDRPPRINPVPMDNTYPTRGLFITIPYSRNYESFTWPGDVPPIIFYSVTSKQRISHCHIAMIFSYYGKSVSEWCRVLELPEGSCSRIKSSWTQTYRYMQLQAREEISYVIHRRSVLTFTDYIRATSKEAAVQNERTTLGFPAMIDGITPRLHGWPSPRIVTLPEITHIDDRERYISQFDGRVGTYYNGQAVVYLKPDNHGEVHTPLTAIFIVVII